MSTSLSTVDKLKNLKYVVMFYHRKMLGTGHDVYYLPLSEQQFKEIQDNTEMQFTCFHEAVQLGSTLDIEEPGDLPSICQEHMVNFLYLMTT